MTQFGELVTVPLRQGWPHESQHFTPWLVENLDRLGRALGLGLEFRAKEHPVGRFFLDILAVDGAGRTVAIENQFGPTDHDHLGKLLTYVAGTDAKVIVWVAETIGPEHLAALEWINNHTTEDIAAYGVEVELLRIGDSPLAPNFRVVARPNTLTKATRKETSTKVDWSWELYASRLNIPAERIEIGKRLVDSVSEKVEVHSLPWQPVFNGGFVSFRRPGGYKVVVVDMYWNGPVRFAITLPAEPEQLNLTSPYPALETRWTEDGREWGWVIKTIDQIPDVGPAIEIARAHTPEAGPLASQS